MRTNVRGMFQCVQETSASGCLFKLPPALHFPSPSPHLFYGYLSFSWPSFCTSDRKRCLPHVSCRACVIQGRGDGHRRKCFVCKKSARSPRMPGFIRSGRREREGERSGFTFEPPRVRVFLFCFFFCVFFPAVFTLLSKNDVLRCSTARVSICQDMYVPPLPV